VEVEVGADGPASATPSGAAAAAPPAGAKYVDNKKHFNRCVEIAKEKNMPPYMCAVQALTGPLSRI
jgi:hypothetical protein